MLKIIAHVFLAVLMIFSSSGIAIGKHYCGGRLKSISLITQPNSCQTGESALTCANGKHDKQGKGCCQNETVFVKGLDVLQNITTSADLPAVPLISIHQNLTVTVATADKEESVVRFFNFHPPPIIRDIPVVVQSFLL